MMQKIVVFFLFLLTSPLFLSCEKEDMQEELNQFDYSTLEDGISDDVCYYENPPYPTNVDSLRILAIGNSFTDDAMTYFDALIKDSNIDEGKICLYKATKGGASFETWIEIFNSEAITYLQRITGTIPMNSQGSLAQLIAQSWDVIVIQQVSNMSYQWSSYTHLRDYVELITSSCPNKNVCLAFQLVWSHTKAEMPYVLQGNIACCKKMSRRYGVNVIIPTGTAIQLARGTHLNDKNYMTRDNWHLHEGMACYIASCTWFESLIHPAFNVSIIGNLARPQGNYSEADIMLGQKCASTAVQNPYDTIF